MKPHLLFCDVGYACFGVEVDPTTLTVVTAPPIARWMIGRRYEDVWRWISARGSCAWVTG